MNYIKRNTCVITGRKDLEFLYKLPNFPVFIGCTDQEQEKDLFFDMEWSISKGSGVIQLAKLLPLDVVYPGFHSEAIGGVWKRHCEQFSNFILKNSKGNSVVEMGGSNGALAEFCLKKVNDIYNWKIVEPNPDPNYQPENKKIEIIESFIEDQISIFSESPIFIHSHVLEHLYNPLETLGYIANKQNNTDEMIFSIPDLYEYLKRKYVNSINFEHTYFLTEKVTDGLLKMLGYRVMNKRHFEGHSIFYYAQRAENSRDFSYSNEFYQEYKKMYLDMIDYYRKDAVILNEKMENFNGKVYLFGGHIFSQFLIYMGLKEKKIEAILDNSNEKNGKRLYGTGLYVFNPSIIEDESQVLVIVKAGRYSNEIEGQLRDINNNIVIYT